MIPRHVAIIPDGNRRWAKSQGLTAFRGHQRGVSVFREITWRAADRGVKYLTFWGISADNIAKRKKSEVAGLMRIFGGEFKKLAVDQEIHRREVRVRVIGRWRQLFPETVKAAIEKVLQVTKAYNQLNLTLLLAYNGTDEMMEAVEKLARQKAKEPAFNLNAQTLKDSLWTRDLPAVDLVIRTGGEPHLSNGFMMWDTADAELYFTDTLWPAFAPATLDLALESFSQRRRREGG